MGCGVVGLFFFLGFQPPAFQKFKKEKGERERKFAKSKLVERCNWEYSNQNVNVVMFGKIRFHVNSGQCQDPSCD